LKPIESFVNDKVKNFKPAVHGAQVYMASQQTGFRQDEILDFSSSVNPFGTSLKALEAIKKDLESVAAYPDSNSTDLREAIAKYYGITNEKIVVGNGSTELMYLFADVFLQKGDFAVIPSPSFGEYESAIEKAGCKIKFLALNKSFQFDLESFKKVIVGAKMVFLCNPNNPTSLLIPKDQLTQMIQAALEQNVLVFLDETFLEFVENEPELTYINKIETFPNLLILRSFTKLYGLTGLRVGFGIANPQIINVLSNCKLPWNVNCLGQTAAIAALADTAHLQKTLKFIKKEKASMLTELNQISCIRVFPADANFFFINIRKSGFTAAQLKQKMLAQGILIRDCSSFKGLDEYYIRIAIKTIPQNQKFLQIFKEILASKEKEHD
jgi:threonine-phosphate decarboxylase